MNLSQLRRAVWLRRLSAASQSRFTLLKNHHRLGGYAPNERTLFESLGTWQSANSGSAGAT
jgi:hypothetical protein